MWEILGKLIVAKGFESCPKCNKSPNLVTLVFCESSTHPHTKRCKMLARYSFLSAVELVALRNIKMCAAKVKLVFSFTKKSFDCF